MSGLGAAQFALPGAVDRLRSVREPDPESELLVLSAIDPAQPYGAAVAWPENAGRPMRVPTALVILANGEPLVWLDRAGHSLLTFAAVASDARWCDRLASLVKDGEMRSLELRKIDGAPARESSWYERLRGAGFAEGYRGLVLRS